jgi:hypothetical protein
LRGALLAEELVLVLIERGLPAALHVLASVALCGSGTMKCVSKTSSKRKES